MGFRKQFRKQLNKYRQGLHGKDLGFDKALIKELKILYKIGILPEKRKT